MVKLMTREDAQAKLDNLRKQHQLMKKTNVAWRYAMKHFPLREMRIAYVNCELHGTGTPKWLVENMFTYSLYDQEKLEQPYGDDDLRSMRRRIKRYEQLLQP
jgi:hypothetical protein